MKLHRLKFRAVERGLSVIAVIGVLLMSSMPVYAATTPKKSTTSSSSTSSSGTASSTTKTSVNNISDGVTTSYNAATTVEDGMLVRLTSKSSNTVVPLSQADDVAMLGVVVPPNNATIVLTPSSVSQQQVLVATSGHYDVLVSNQNGPINVGDYITISAIDGVGMKADTTEDEVLGKAAGTFSGVTDVIGTINVKGQAGTSSQVAIGRIPVDLSIARNPLSSRQADYVPTFLSKVATTLANKPVSAARIYLSLAILIITGIVTGNMLYSGVKHGMVAIGRNPLSKKSIIKSLVETVIAGLIIFIVGILAVYLLLKI
jgi:hypothetical protein